MSGLVPGIHVLGPARKDVDGRDKPGHDGRRLERPREATLRRLAPVTRHFKQQSRHTPPRSRGAVRPSFASTALDREGAGNAGCALHPRSRVHNVKSTRGSHHRFTGAIRHSPRNGLTAYFAISPVIGLCCHRRLSDKAGPRPVGPTSPPQDLTPASRRQDHTTSPSAPASFVLRACDRSRVGPRPAITNCAPTPPRPPHPVPRS